MKRSSVRSKSSGLMDVILTFPSFTEEVHGLDVSECVTPEGCLVVSKLMALLQQQCGFNLTNRSVHYSLHGLLLLCPKGDLDIDEEDWRDHQPLTFIFGHQQIEVYAFVDNDREEDREEEDREDVGGKSRRLQERKIKNVVEKVLKWRELYAGVGEVEKVSLEDGAKMVNISKKTLDDYLSQIKKGRKYGFNFNQHRNDKIGVLRQFIRKVDKLKK